MILVMHVSNHCWRRPGSPELGQGELHTCLEELETACVVIHSWEGGCRRLGRGREHGPPQCLHLTHCLVSTVRLQHPLPSLGVFLVCETRDLLRLPLSWNEKIHVGRLAQSALIKCLSVLL